MATGASGLTEKQLLALDFLGCRLLSVQPTRHGIKFGSGRKVDHVLHLGHIGHQQSINHVDTLLDRADGITIKIGGALLEFREVFD